MLARVEAGEPKSGIEVDEFGSSAGHGKCVSSFIKWALGVETEKQSRPTQRVAALRAEVGDLRARLQLYGDQVGDDVPELRELLIGAARRAAMTAIRAYNDPMTPFRTET